MSKEYIAKIEFQVSEAVKNIQGLQGALEEMQDQNAEVIKANQKLQKQLTKDAKKTQSTFKKLGNFLKGLTIFTVVAKAVGKLTEVMSSNQVIADKLAVVSGTVSSVIKQVAGAFAEAGTKVAEMTNGFEGTKAVISSLITLGLTPLKLAWDSIRGVVVASQLAWEKSWFGGGDPMEIERLEGELTNIGNSLKETGQEALNAGSDIIENAGKMIDEVVETTKLASDQISKINIEATASNQDKLIQLRNDARLAIAENDKLQFQYQQQAEQQRQIRDNVQLSITDRIKANDELGRVLEEQSKLQEANALKRLEQATFELSLNKDNIELQEAKIEAEKNLADVRENIEGFRSEQLVNEQGLELEAIDLINAKKDSESARELQRLEFEANQEIDALARLEKLRENLNEEELIETERLTNQISRYKLGTQARQDAEQQLLDFQQNIAQQKQTLDTQITKQEEANEKAKQKFTLGIAKQTFGNLASILGEESAAGKAAAVAATTIATYESATQAYKSMAGIPVVGPVLGGIAAAAAVVSGIKTVQGIINTPKPNIPGAKSSGGSYSQPRQSSVASAPSVPPSFNVVGASATSQLAETIANTEKKPQRAYVVSGDVTSAQSMERQTVEEASI